MAQRGRKPRAENDAMREAIDAMERHDLLVWKPEYTSVRAMFQTARIFTNQLDGRVFKFVYRLHHVYLEHLYILRIL